MDIKLRAACDVDFGFARGVYFETRYRTHAVAPFSMSGNATDQGLASQNVPTSLWTRNNFRLARYSGAIPNGSRNLRSSSGKSTERTLAGRFRFGMKDGFNWLLEQSRNVEGKRQAGIVLPVLNGIHGLP